MPKCGFDTRTLLGPSDPEPPPSQVRRHLVQLGSTRLAGWPVDSQIAVSPNGQWLALVVDSGGTNRLMLRALNQLEYRVIPGTVEVAPGPFFSPDSQWLGFFDSGKARLVKVAVKGGTPIELCAADPLAAWLGGSWGDDDHIVFSDQALTGLRRISAQGGAVEEFTTVDLENGDVVHATPVVLPGSEAVLFTVRQAPELSQSRVVVVDLQTKKQTLLLEQAGRPRYSPSGHLIYAAKGRLMGVPFDLNRLELTGPARPITEPRMVNGPSYPVQYSFSDDGQAGI